MKRKFKTVLCFLLVAMMLVSAAPLTAFGAADTYTIRFWLDDEMTVAYGEPLVYSFGDEVVFPDDPADDQLPDKGTYFECWDGDTIDVIDSDTVDTYFYEEAAGEYFYDLVAIVGDCEYTVSIYYPEDMLVESIEGMLYGDEIYEEDLPDTYSDGYTFLGWFIDGDVVTEWPVTVTGDMDIRGKVSVNVYNAVFYGNGGMWLDDNGEPTVESVTIPVEYESEITAPAENPVREGYTLDPDMPWDPELGVMDIEDQSFFANWIANKYTITFDVDGVKTESTQTFGKKIALPAGISTVKDGYNFVGWTADGTGLIEDITAVSVPAADTTYTAVFEPDASGVNYTVNRYFMNLEGNYDGVAPESVSLNAVAGTTVSYNAEVEGFTLDAALGNLTETVKGDGSTVINAYYSRDKVEVTVNGETSEYFYGDVIEKPEDPVKEGYVFIGWADENGEPVQFPVTVGAEPVVFVPQFEATECKAVFMSDGNEFAVVTVLYGEQITPPAANPAKDGYVFSGWSLDGVNVLAQLGTMNADSKTFHAVWQAKHTHTPETVREEPDCTNDGSEYTYCTSCGETIGEVTVLPSKGHTPADEWETVLVPTTEKEGKKIKKCTVCGETAESESISKLEVIRSAETGVTVEYSPNDYNGEVNIIVKEISDTSTKNLINSSIGFSNSKVYDVTMILNGVEIQPAGSVKISIPLPEAYVSAQSSVHYLDTAANKTEDMNAVCQNSVMIFVTGKTGVFAVVEKYAGTFEIREPSQTKINCGDSIILHADVSVALPEGAYIEWTASNGNFKMSASEDGTTCKITSDANGKTIITASVYDSSGNLIVADEQEMTSNANIFRKIIAFFKKIFNLTKTFTEIFSV